MEDGRMSGGGGDMVNRRWRGERGQGVEEEGLRDEGKESGAQRMWDREGIGERVRQFDHMAIHTP